MEVSLTDCALQDFGPPRVRKRSGGPSSADGKKVTSQNARKHGCRSQQRIVPGERRKDYNALWDRWLQQYEPETPGDVAQLERVVDADWRLQRTERAYTDVERALRRESKDAAEWTGELLGRLQLMQRYRTGAENSLHKELRLLESLKARRDAEERERERRAETERVKEAEWARQNPTTAEGVRKYQAEQEAAATAAQVPPSPAQLLFQGQNCVTTRSEPVRLEQWVEIRVVDGKTLTEFYPSNEELIECGKAMMPPPEAVHRRLNFPDAIPAGYEWVGVSDPKERAQGGSGMQRLTADAWLALIAREAEHPDGRLLPAPHVPGAGKRRCCGCPVCVTYAEIYKRRWERRLS